MDLHAGGWEFGHMTVGSTDGRRPGMAGNFGVIFGCIAVN